MSKVIIFLPNKIQANALANLAEEGKLAELINDHLYGIDLSEHEIINV